MSFSIRHSFLLTCIINIPISSLVTLVFFIESLIIYFSCFLCKVHCLGSMLNEGIRTDFFITEFFVSPISLFNNWIFLSFTLNYNARNVHQCYCVTFCQLNINFLIQSCFSNVILAFNFGCFLLLLLFVLRSFKQRWCTWLLWFSYIFRLWLSRCLWFFLFSCRSIYYKLQFKQSKSYLLWYLPCHLLLCPLYG